MRTRKRDDSTIETPGQFAEFVESQRPQIARLFQLLGVAPTVADDILQEACVLYLAKASNIDPTKVPAWFFSVLRNQSLMFFRTRRPSSPLLEANLPSIPPEQHAWEYREDLMRALGGLSGVQREIVIGSCIDGYSHGELAKRLGYSPESLPKLKARALARIKQALTVSGS